ncbi:MAG: hypothetical protein ACYSTT_11190 [Planctomycetota bacterium]|jgi:hypothetical protein
MGYMNIALIGLVAVAVVAVRLEMSKIREDIKGGQEKLTSELSEIKKLLQK